MKYRVLIVGYRPGISDSLTRQGIAHGVWNNKPLKTSRDFTVTLIKEFPRSRDAINTIGDQLRATGPYTHVIAGSEAGVYPASVLRRRLDARKSQNSIALRCHDKLVMKEHLLEYDIAMLDFLAGDRNADANEVIQKLGLPVVIKARQLSGGRDIIFADSADVLRQENKRSRILERYIDAAEFSIESFVSNRQILFQSITQYYVKKHINIIPALIEQNLRQRLYEFNRQVLKAMNISWGITHLEVYVKGEDIYFGEIALRPPGGYLMELISASYGFNSWDAQIATELDMTFEFPHHAHAYSAAIIFHPGEGVLKNVENWEQACQLPGVFQSKLKRASGDALSRRESVGEDVGYILLSHSNSDTLLENIHWVQQQVRFEFE